MSDLPFGYMAYKQATSLGIVEGKADCPCCNGRGNHALGIPDQFFMLVPCKCRSGKPPPPEPPKPKRPALRLVA